MRKSKQITIGDKTVLINELTVRDVKELWKELNGMSDNGEHFIAGTVTPELRRIWDKAIVGFKIEDMDDYAPSEIRGIYDAFVEVNDSFFAVASQVEGDNVMIRSMRVALVNSLIERLAALSNTDTQEPTTTDTPSL